MPLQGGVVGLEFDRIEALRKTISGARNSALYADRLPEVELRSVEDLRALPLTTSADLQRAGLAGTRAAPLDRVCHYGETSGTSGGPTNSTWLTAEDLHGNARAIAARLPEVFSPGRILLNRFPFMSAPGHLMQLIAQQGHGVSIPAGNINWDVPFPRALELAVRTGAHVLAGFPVEPIILSQLARNQGLDPAKDTAIDSFLIGGAPLPPVMQRRIERTWGARVIEFYGSTETMLLGIACAERTLHIESDIVHCEILDLDSEEPAAEGAVGRLVVTTLTIEGSPLVRFETGDVVRRLPPCRCGDERQGIVVLGRANDTVDLQGASFHSYEIIEGAAAAADALDSSVFFTVVLPDRLLIRIEGGGGSGDPVGAAREHLGSVPIEIEQTEENALLDVEHLSRNPSVYKPVLISDWRRPGRQILSVSQGMIEWPSLSGAEVWRLAKRTVRRTLRSRQLARALRVAKGPGH